MIGGWKCLYLSTILFCISNTVFAAQPAEEDTTLVVLETELGKLVLEIYEAQAPSAAAYFLGYVDRGDYDGATFYRAGSLDQTNEVQLIQGGLLLEALNSASPPDVADFGAHFLEQFDATNQTGLIHEYGSVSLARDLLDTGHVIPEIVICFRATPAMDYGGRNKPDARGFPAFGKVVAGMDVAQAIADRERSGSTNIEFLKGQILSSPLRISRAYRLRRSGFTLEQ